MANPVYEQIQAHLKKPDAQGQTVYDHVAAVILKLVQEKPDDPLSVFENVSAVVKESISQAQPQQKQAPETKPPKKVKPPKKEGEEEQEEEEKDEEAEIKYDAVPDFLNDVGLFEWAGVNLGKDETFLLSLALRRLAKQEQKLKSIRFWGKVFGTKQNYYIAETTLAEYPEVDAESKKPDDRSENPGQGLNEFVYYYIQDLSSPWVALPDVRPEQVKLARTVHKLFTGVPTAGVAGFPRFPWSEAVMLRCQIARISCATYLQPAGLQKLEEQEEGAEEPPAVEPNEDYKPQPPNKMISLASWVHSRPLLLLQGRLTPFKKEEEEEEDPDKPKRELTAEEKEKPTKPLQPIANDKRADLPQCWITRMAPSHSVHGIASAQSLTWPGAINVMKGKRFCTVYVGNGLKYRNANYTPPPPLPIQTEYQPPMIPKFEPKKEVKEEDAEKEEDEEKKKEEEEKKKAEKKVELVSELQEQPDVIATPEQKTAEEQKEKEKAEKLLQEKRDKLMAEVAEKEKKEEEEEEEEDDDKDKKKKKKGGKKEKEKKKKGKDNDDE